MPTTLLHNSHLPYLFSNSNSNNATSLQSAALQSAATYSTLFFKNKLNALPLQFLAYLNNNSFKGNNIFKGNNAKAYIEQVLASKLNVLKKENVEITKASRPVKNNVPSNSYLLNVVNSSSSNDTLLFKNDF